MDAFTNPGVIMVGVMLACMGWLVMKFLQMCESWDLPEQEADMDQQAGN